MPHAHKGARNLCCPGEGENPRTPSDRWCPMPIKGLGFFVVDVPPPPRGRSARSAPCARAELCLFSTIPATFQQRVPATFWRRSSGPWSVARTSPEQVVGTSPEQGVWVGLASLRHPCLQDGMTETELPGGSTGCTTPASPTGGTGGHALRATQQLCAGFASPSPTSGRSQTSSVGNPRSPAVGAATACPTRGRASCASPSASPPVARALDWELNE